MWVPKVPSVPLNRDFRRYICHRENPGYEDFRVHSYWKHLRVGYAYEQLGVFGPELQHLARPIQSLPGFHNWQLPMCGGEMLLLAARRAPLTPSEDRPIYG